jgi:Protein of unknown function (DUF2637)
MSAVGTHSKLGRLGAALTDNPWLTGVALIGFSVSFQTISDLARAHGLPGYPVLYPVLIDVGILAMIVESRKAIEARRSDLAPRILAWALIGLTLYVNAHGAAPHDWLGRALHVVAPALWAALLELTRWRRIARKRAEEKRDRIPLARWLLAPWRTAWLFRRMILWGECSYARAVTRQAVVLYATAVAQADRRVGRAPLLWRRRLPVTLRWQLAEGKPPREVEDALAARGAETWQEPAARWVAGALRMLPRSVIQAPAGVTPEVPASDPPEAPPEGAPATRQRSPEAAVKRARRLGRKATDSDLLEAIAAMAADGIVVTRYRVVKDLPVGEVRADRLIAQWEAERAGADAEVIQIGAR